MALDDIINSIAGGDIEQLLLFLPIFIIGASLLVIVIPYIKENWKTILNKLSKFKTKPKHLISKKTKLPIEGPQKPEINYKKEIEKILQEENTTKAMDKISILINQYFSQLFDLHHVFTYEELINEIEKKGKIKLKEFCENLLQIEFSKDEVSRKELENIAYEFLNITKEYRLEKIKEGVPKKPIKKIKFFNQFFNRLRRFKKELQRDLEKKKTIEDKLEKIIENIGKTIWDFIKSHLLPTKVPKKISFKIVSEDLNQHKSKKGLKAVFGGESPTIEGFFYFIYLIMRKRIREKKKIKEIKEIIKKGRSNLLKTGDVVQAKELYNSLSLPYNALSNKNKKRIIPKVSLFYKEITDCINFQKAMMNMLQLKLALRSKKYQMANYFYLKISKLYEELPSKYKNRIYEQFLDLEKELNIATNKGGY